MGKVGRPTKLTKDRADRYIATLMIGGTHKSAASAAGVDEATTQRWRNENAGFAARVDDAIPARERAWCQTIHAAIRKGDARMALAMLERTNPNDYGRRTRIEGPVELGGSVKLELGKHMDEMTREQLEKLASE